MSVASSFPACIKISTSSSSPSCSYSSSSSSSSSSNSLMFYATKPYHVKTTIRCSQTEGPIRRPVAPSVRQPSPPTLKPPTPPSQTPPPPKPAAQVSGLTVGDDKNVITLEFQRVKAKEIQEYFKQKKLEAASQGPFFGWVAKNEIGNGRWAMFGFAVGMLTEYATGSDFVVQVKILLSNFGIVDLE